MTKKLDKSMSNFSNYSVEIKEEEEDPSDEQNATEKDVVITEEKSDDEKEEAGESEGVKTKEEEKENKTDNSNSEENQEISKKGSELSDEAQLIAPNPTGSEPKPINLVSELKEFHAYADNYESSEEEPEITIQDIMNEMGN